MYDLNTIKKINKNGLKGQYQSPQTYTLTIGRNVNKTPLPDHKWRGFQSSINSFIKGHNSEIFVNSRGFGQWEGIEEENCTWVFSTKKYLDLDHLKSLAKLFRQDAIALTRGSTQFIG